MITLRWHDTRHAEIVLRLDISAAQWIAENLPPTDTATKDLWQAIYDTQRTPGQHDATRLVKTGHSEFTSDT